MEPEAEEQRGTKSTPEVLAAGKFSPCFPLPWCHLQNGYGSKLTRRGKPQVLVHVSTYQGNPFWNSGFLSHSQMDAQACALGAICPRAYGGRGSRDAKDVR